MTRTAQYENNLVNFFNLPDLHVKLSITIFRPNAALRDVWASLEQIALTTPTTRVIIRMQGRPCRPFQNERGLRSSMLCRSN